MSSSLLKRIRTLELAEAGGPLETIQIEAVPNAEQLRTIAEAIRRRRNLLVFVAKGDTVWPAGSGRPPWELPGEPDVNQFV